MWCLFYGPLCNFWCSVLFLNRANCFIKNEICRCCFVFSVGSMSCRSISCSVRVWSLRMGMDQIGWTLVCSTPVKQSRGRWSEIILFNALCSCKCSESFQTFKPSQRATEAVREGERAQFCVLFFWTSRVVIEFKIIANMNFRHWHCRCVMHPVCWPFRVLRWDRTDVLQMQDRCIPNTGLGF